MWRSPANNPDAQRTAAELPARIGRLGRQLEAMRARHKRFNMETALVDFRRAATLDLERAPLT
jgi:hypothetical protein